MFQNVQILRGIAAAMVVLFHAVPWFRFDAATPPLMQQVFHLWGKSGVDLFFVISGFVIMLSQSRAQRDFGAFLRDRALRILPLYWLLTAAFMALLVALPGSFAGQPPVTAERALLSFGMVNWLLLREWPILFVGWSLEYEALFYLLFALAGLVLPLSRVVWVLGAVLALSVALGWLENMVLEFVAGMLIARLRMARAHLPFAGGILALGVIGFVLPILGTPIEPRAFYQGIPSAMIVLGAVFLPQVKSRFGEYLGSASYSIYLGQVFALPAANKLVQKLMPGAAYDLKVLVMGAVGIALGCLLYSVIERPMTRWLHGRNRRAHRAPATGQAAPARARPF